MHYHILNNYFTFKKHNVLFFCNVKDMLYWLNTHYANSYDLYKGEISTYYIIADNL